MRARAGNIGTERATFPKLVAELDYPMFVVTARARGERSGCLVGFATQTSIHPPRFLVCISTKNHTYPVASAAKVLAVHLPSRSPRERELAELFGSETGDRADKFAGVTWHEGPDGVPLIDELPNRFTGRVLERLDLGDHTGFLLEPVEAEKGEELDGLGFQDVKGIEPGHGP
jgi:flavin reductase (DIM6/NTAB) family NADH-FMN oxidoreductase RutF